MKWQKMGIVFVPDASSWWAVSHAMLPTPFLLDEQTIRVFCSCCDAQGLGRPGFVDVSASDPREVIRVSTAPLLELGDPGSFDDNGVVVSSVVRGPGERLYMYYVGFELGTKVRYRLFTGLAISEDNGETFVRAQRSPVLDRTDAELLFRCGPFVKYEGGLFRLWYVAGSTWEIVSGKSLPVYVLKYLTSPDGVSWAAVGQTVLDLGGPDEHGFGRPWVQMLPSGKYQLFYSIRRRSLNAYRLGYAESDDGLAWIRRDDQMNLDVSAGSFDSDAIMYSATLTHGGETYCFYNGNDFGAGGFAVARLLEP